MIDHKLFQTRLNELIALPSVSCTQANLDMSNRHVVEKLASWLETFGFQCQLNDVPNTSGKTNLIATLGAGNNGLVLAGHTDTVPYNEERWQSDPLSLTVKNDRFYGLGTCDMKGFFPTVLAALDKLKPQLKNIQEPLIILATADEESSMSGARALSDGDMKHARYAVIGEPTGMTPIHMHKGIMMEKIRVLGQAGHSSNPALGNNALEAMHKVMQVLMDYRNQLQKQNRNSAFAIDMPTMNLGCIHGGDNPNRICGHCELEFDLRPLPGMSIDNLHQDIERLLLPLQQQTSTQITLEKLFPGVPAYAQEKHSDLVTTVEKLTKSEAQSVAFATEAPFLHNLGLQTVVMGPGSIDQAHQPNEFLSFDEINPAVNIIEQLIGKYCFNHSI